MKEKATVGAAITGCLVLILIDIALDFFVAWVLWMFYNTVAPSFHWPLVQYWTMFYIVLALGILVGFFKSRTNSKK